MPLPIVPRPYPLGPYSLETSSGRYWFNSSFRASHLIPGRAQEELTAGEDRDYWEALGDGERMPEVLTLTGHLIAFVNVEGLQQDLRDLEAALEAATALYRNSGDATHREMSLDGGQVASVRLRSPYHYLVTLTLYPTSGEVTNAASIDPPGVHELTTEAGDLLTTESGEQILVIV